MKYEEIKKTCRKAWIEKFNYLCIDFVGIKQKVKIVVSVKAKTPILILFPKVNLFVFNWKQHLKNQRRFRRIRRAGFITKSSR